MYQKVEGLVSGSAVTLEEQAQFMNLEGSKVEVMVPKVKRHQVKDSNGQMIWIEEYTSIILICVRMPDGSLGIAEFNKNTFNLVAPITKNSKGYKDYPADVREKMNLFSGKEKKARREAQAQQDAGQVAPATTSGTF